MMRRNGLWKRVATNGSGLYGGCSSRSDRL